MSNSRDLGSYGTSALTDTGVDTDNVPLAQSVLLLADAGTAATKNTGVTTGTIPFAEDVVLVDASGNVVGDISLADNDKLLLGDSDDLQIYHDGSNSYIKETGIGYLTISSGTDLVLESAGGEKFIHSVGNEGVTSYYNGIAKLATTNTGIDVNGTVTTDGLTVSGPDNVSITQTHTDGNVVTFTQSGTGGDIDWRNANGDALIRAADASRLLVANNGDISFYEDTGTTPKFFWDASAESLGIGTNSPTNPLTVIGSATIGTTTAAPITTELHIHKNAAGGIVPFGDESTVVISTNATDAGGQGYIGSLWFGSQDISSVNQYGWKMAGMAGYMSGDVTTTGGSADLLFYTANASQTGTERMRIDSSGNLLVGKTALNTNTVGLQLENDGYLSACRDGGNVLLVNRKSSDGALATFQKNGVTVGSIGTLSGDLTIGTGNAGLRFNDPFGELLPYNVSAGSGTDATVTLGSGGVRFKDLYLSGGVYLGGTGAANKLDDYEEGTWIPTVQGAATNPVINYGSREGTYTKVGNLVTAFFFFNVGSVTSQGGGLLILAGLPFTVENNNTQQTAAAMTQMQICNSSGTAFGRATPNTASLYLGSYNTSGGFNISNASNMKAGYCVGKITYTAA